MYITGQRSRSNLFIQLFLKNSGPGETFYRGVMENIYREEKLTGRLIRNWHYSQMRQISQLMENPNAGLVFVSKGQRQLNQANKPLETWIRSVVADIVDPKKLLRG